ncbi:MAG: 50S ribosomal protein L7Ae [archaeon]
MASGKQLFAKYEVPKELSEKALEVLEKVRVTGKLKKGTNEVTKMIERGQALLVVIAMDVEPAEVIAHIPPLCEEKGVPFVIVPGKADLGAASGIEVPTSAVAVVKPGDSKALIDDLAKKISEFSKK